MLEKEDLQALRAIIKEEITPIQAQLDRVEDQVSKMQDQVTQVQDQVTQVQELATRTALKLENVIEPAIDAIIEGQELTHDRMKELAGNDEVDSLRGELRVLKRVVAEHSREIEALKKAQ